MVSRINPTLVTGDVVTDPRSLAYYIVTEYGGVNLVGCSTWERAEKLISVAAPGIPGGAELLQRKSRAFGSGPTDGNT